MNEPALKSDCSACVALCCVSLTFERSDMFAIDKDAGVACPNLGASHRCNIHDDLKDRGFAGCIRYECFGAGQRVTQEMYGGRSWRDDAALLSPMMTAFRGMRVVHELLMLLETARALPLTEQDEQERNQLHDELSPENGWDNLQLLAFEASDLPTRARAFFASLRSHIKPEDISTP